MLVLLLHLLSAAVACGALKPLPTLTRAEQVHSLTYQESLREYPVHLLRAQVLYYDSELGNLFVRDSSHGVYVDMRGQPPLPLHVGDIMEVEGVTAPGGYAPFVDHTRIRVVGRHELPAAPRWSLDHLLTGVEDSQWVEVEGIVRSVEESKHITAYANQAASGGTTVLMTLATGAGRLDVIVRESLGFDYAKLMDADVVVSGVSGPRFNQKRQLTGIHLFAQNFAQVRVLQYGPNDPFSLPIRQLDTVMGYTPDVVPGHRIRVQGVVTANQAGRFISIAAGGHGLFVRMTNAHDIIVGDVVDVVGFPAMGDYTPVLEDVLYRKIGSALPPNPVVLSASDMFEGDADGELIRIRARLLKQTRTLQELTLLVVADDRTFSAVLTLDQKPGWLNSLREGSILELTGTCFVEVFPDKTPRAVQILLRSPEDIVVVGAAPGWTAERTIAALGILFAGVIVALGWNAMLRHRVRAQTAALQQAHQEAAAIGELARAMQEVATHRKFTARVSASGSEQVTQLGIGFNKMLSELEEGHLATSEAEAKLQRQALTDELTGLANRRLLSDRLAHSLAIAQREQRILALLYIDLDGFKPVNDRLGHAVGDLLLTQVAKRLRSRVRQADTLARLGGDEFTIVLTTMHTAKEAEMVAASLLESLSEVFIVAGHEIVLGASIGISLFPQDGADPVALLQQADSAMYAAKSNGKNRVERFTPELGSSLRDRLSLENQLRGAIARREIQLHYQPEFDAISHRLMRFEALARWIHPILGTISPAKFISVAEESGQIVTLGAYLLEDACEEAAQWQAIAPYPIQVAVNVSSLQFTRASFVDEVAHALKQTGLNPELLQIELTESIMLIGAERAAGTMKRLRTLGVSLAIDDFGTGYSCLSYLPKLPFDTLKIDGSFVHELDSCSETKAIVRFLITLAHSLNMQVVVEGVETTLQLDIIKELGGNQIQGFLLGRPTANPRSWFGLEEDL
jgi:diguanylate cyclase (GGDEF)-like protein